MSDEGLISKICIKNSGNSISVNSQSKQKQGGRAQMYGYQGGRSWAGETGRLGLTHIDTMYKTDS